ncbi:MAG: DUF58 domain-containing protein [Acidobacteria bacterium]|nr:DUF58 domain-containing protein [Acidobacteriota bacterium]
MRFVFTRKFYLLLAFGLVPLSLSWSVPFLRWIVVGFDAAIIVVTLIDYFTSRRLANELVVNRSFAKRFAIGDPTRVTLRIENPTPRDLDLRIKDEYPDAMRLGGPREAEFKVAAHTSAEFSYDLTPPNRGRYEFGKLAARIRSRLGLVWCQTEFDISQAVKVYPNMRRAREIELKALGAQSYLAIQRKSVRRGEGREFESMRDYVRGDEMRHLSWTATARRSKLITRQYQIERDQTIIVAIDGGRLMTGRINDETKFDTAIHASLALMSAAARGGDNCGLMVFGRRVKKFLLRKRHRTYRRRARSAPRSRARTDRAELRAGVSIYRVEYEKTRVRHYFDRSRRQRIVARTDQFAASSASAPPAARRDDRRP